MNKSCHLAHWVLVRPNRRTASRFRENSVTEARLKNRPVGSGAQSRPDLWGLNVAGPWKGTTRIKGDSHELARRIGKGEQLTPCGHPFPVNPRYTRGGGPLRIEGFYLYTHREVGFSYDLFRRGAGMRDPSANRKPPARLRRGQRPKGLGVWELLQRDPEFDAADARMLARVAVWRRDDRAWISFRVRRR